MMAVGILAPLLPHGMDMEHLHTFAYPAFDPVEAVGLTTAYPPAHCLPVTSFDRGLAVVVNALGARCQRGSLALVQVWKPSGVRSQGGGIGQPRTPYLCCNTTPSFMGSQGTLHEFRFKSCQFGIAKESMGLIAKVMTGAVQVVQNVAAVPSNMHPKNKLSGNNLEGIGELIYIPIYDVREPQAGVKAVLEILVACGQHEAMLVANVISHVASVMDAVQLSLSSMTPFSAAAAAAPPAICSMQPHGDYMDTEEAPRPRKSMSRCASVRGSVADLLEAELAKARSDPS